MVDKKHLDMQAKLHGSLLLFTQEFYYLRTGRYFELSYPVSRESHYITICRALTRVFRVEGNLLIINIPPRIGKTELVISLLAWPMAPFPAPNFFTFLMLKIWR